MKITILKLKSALQTSRTYIRETDKDNSYVNNSSLSTTLDLIDMEY